MSNVPINQQALDQKNKPFVPDLSLEGEIQSVPQWVELDKQREEQYQSEMHAIEQDRIQKYLDAQKQVNTPKLYYEEMAERIEKKTYDRKPFVKWKLGRSSQMKEVTKSMKKLAKLLDTPVGDTDFKMIRDEYLRLTMECETYLNTHNAWTEEGKIRYEMVEKIQKHAEQEMRSIEGNSQTVTEKDRQDKIKWRDILIQAPLLSVTKDQIHTPNYQGQTSQVKIITVAPGQNYYFKGRETAPQKAVKGRDYFSHYAMFSEACHELMIELTELEAKYQQVNKQGPLDEKTTIVQEERNARIEKIRRVLDAGVKVLPIISQDRWLEAPGAAELAQEVLKDRWDEKDSLSKESKEALIKETQELANLLYEITSIIKKKETIAEAGIFKAGLKDGTDLSMRNEATSVMADFFEISDLVMESRTVELEVDGKREKGLCMKEVKGVNGIKLLYGKYAGMTAHLTANAIKQLMTLQVFDVICGQTDRNYNNIMMDVVVKDGKVMIQRITGIDNDLCFGKYSAQRMQRNHETKLIPFFKPLTAKAKGEKEGEEVYKPSLLGLDKKVADRILEIKPEMIYSLLKPFLSDDEIWACQDRLKSVQQFLMSEEGKKTILTQEEQWEAIRKRVDLEDLGTLDTVEKKIKDGEFAREIESVSYISTFMTGREVLKASSTSE